MTNKVGVFRTGEELREAVEEIAACVAAKRALRVPAGERPFNSQLIEHLELGCLLELSEITAGAAWRAPRAAAPTTGWTTPGVMTPTGCTTRWFGAATTDGRFTKPARSTITRFQPQERGY